MVRKESIRSLNMLNAEEALDIGFTCMGYPKVEYSADVIPCSLIPFDKCIRSVGYDSYVHFYIEDYQFERIWTKPNRYVNLLSKFKGMIAPDFSVYYDMPIHMKRWNMYRNRFIAAYMQKHGISVIPNIQVVDQDLWEDAIDGIGVGSVVSVNCTGVKRRFFARAMLNAQMRFLKERLNPRVILCYGSDEILRDFDNVIYFENNHIKRIRDVQRD